MVVSGPFFSQAWYRVADLRPRIKSHARVYPQRFRGMTWYVLQDPQSGRFHRLSDAAHLAVSLMDGKRSVADIWDSLGVHLGEHQPTQDQMIQLLRQLHAADLLGGDLRPDVGELTRRTRDRERQERRARWRNPIAVRIPLFDPDRLLTRTLPYVAPVFSRMGFVVWLAIVLWAIVMAGMHWNALMTDISARALSPSNIVLMLLVYPAIKAFHELGHGWATKRWGGEVHEIGVMLLIFFPVPYVDGSDSAGFASKWQRAVVGSAGIMVELLLASLAMFVWILVEPGVIRAIAFNVILIASVSTVFFNGNPLLRYDGYYVLSDVVEIPNLGPRANQYLAYLAKRKLLGLIDVHTPVTAPGEVPWLVGYGIVAYLYRIGITLTIALYLAGKAFFIGVLIAILAVATTVVVPLWRGVRYLVGSPETGTHRTRTVATGAALAIALLLVLFALPVPYATTAEGVVWVPENATVRAGTGGTVARVLAEQGVRVNPGQPLIELVDPYLELRIKVLDAQARQVQLRVSQAIVTDQTRTRMYREQLKQVTAALKQERAKQGELIVRANASGILALPMAQDLPGRMIERGALLGYVIDSQRPIVRAVIGQDDIELIMRRGLRAQARFAQQPRKTCEAVPLRATPAAIDRLPTAVLSREGGGRWAEMPDQSGQAKLVQRAFLLDLSIVDATVPGGTVGSRVYLRFDHGYEPTASRLIRGLRQLLLSQLDV